MSYIIAATYTALGALVILLLALLIAGGRRKQCVDIHEPMLAPEELEKHAVEVARNHLVGKTAKGLQWLVRRMNDNYSQISGTFNALNNDTKALFPTAPAAEWLLDNFYIIEEQVKVIRKNLSKGYYSKLPVLKSGYLSGYPRVYSIALELVAHTDGRIDEKGLVNFISAYQSQSLLSMGELWAVPLMLRIALIENIRNLCEKIMKSQQEWHKSESLAQLLSGSNLREEEIPALMKEFFPKSAEISPSFVEHLLQRVRKSGKSLPAVTRFLDALLSESNMTSEAVAGLEHQLQAARQVSIGNTITGLRLISDIDWADIFESLSQVEQILRRDPGGIYHQMDFESRDHYRHEVEKLARVYRTSEINVAKKAVERASDAVVSGSDMLPQSHVGFYLVGKGKKALMGSLGTGKRGGVGLAPSLFSHTFALYSGIILLLTAFITAYFTCYSGAGAFRYDIPLMVLTAVVVLIPCSELAILLINSVLGHVFRPAMLPKLELKKGVPEELRTMVIIPTLLPGEKRVKELLEQLEMIYLGNREENLFFTLVGDFKDAAGPDHPEDERILKAAFKGVKELNDRYASDGKEIFFFVHRVRTYNPSQDKWMGWERKRGAIVEFNRLLQGDRGTGYRVASGDLTALPEIKYIITLDADTALPMGSAKRLVGTMAHPLNRAVVDSRSGIVKDGYGLLQPRISVSVPSANHSLFTRIFAGQGGIDPYTTAVSDIYQDVFGEGIFTGKGIYDLRIFQQTLGTRIPENTVLSHDLIEGCHVRAGLVTDIELVDGYPARYNSYSMRLHRWVRGDWQLLPWLGSKVRDHSGQWVDNPLNALSKWKILDNLRRSLLSPSLLLLFILGCGVLPGSFLVWSGLALAAAFTPVLSHLIHSALSGSFRMARVKRNSTIMGGFRAAFYQSILILAFIPYQAWLMCDAITKTLVRVYITRKNLLEWVTAADMEISLKNDLRSFWRRMWISAPAALLAIALSLALSPITLLVSVPLGLLWLAAPLLAYIISQPYRKKTRELSVEENARLRRLARKTWRYFEDFAVEADHFLPPDNYQEDPPRGAAHRTSPTNIGLLLASTLSARDMGYVSSVEMVERINRTVTTMEQMDKWKGHLYNWYNTITLDTLRPLYVSTVDSGNLIGYMMVVRQGLKEYLTGPAMDLSLVVGLKDTLALVREETGQGIGLEETLLDEMLSRGSMDLGGWSSVLDLWAARLEMPEVDASWPDSYWLKRLQAMVSVYRKEVSDFFPVSDAVDMEGAPVITGEASLVRLSAAYGEMLQSALDAGTRDRIGAAKILTDTVIGQYRELIERLGRLIHTMEFSPLFDQKRQLFSIGFNVEDGHLSKSYYDLLASEARQASYISVARGEVEPKHWFRLGRKLTVVDGYKGLVSWTGTMFEYLMPLLIMKNYENTLLDETYGFVVKAQKKYARHHKIPWGVSESGYSAFDINLNYQYRAFGVPDLGLKRGLGNDRVIAPYAAVLAVGIDPEGVVENLRELEKKGMDGGYGLYEAIDFTPSRLDRTQDYSIVKSFMAHHQGMSMLALNNYFHGGVMQMRFHANPMIRSAEFLLQERVPEKGILTKEHREEIISSTKKTEVGDGDAVRTLGISNAVLPSAHILSNGSYSVMITNGGSGYSKREGMAVTRWSRDARNRNNGMYVFVQNINSNNIWSATFDPFDRFPEKYRVVFSPDKAEFLRRDGNIETYTEITVSPEDDAEVRRISLTNHSQHARMVEVTSYFEAVLASLDSDIAHPAFSKLFVRTEFVRDYECILASRRHRGEGQKPIWLVHTMAVEGEVVGDIQFETDRMKFIGRNRDLSHPVAMEPDHPLTNTDGSVLDPVISLRRRIRIDPGQTVRISYMVAVAETKRNALELAEKYNDFRTSERVFELAWTRSQVESRYLGLNAEDVEFYLELVPFLLFSHPLRQEEAGRILKNTRGQSDLWPYGISGDVPILLVSVSGREDLDLVTWALKGHEYWRMKGLTIDLLFLVEEESGYAQPALEMVRDAAAACHAREMMDRSGGVFIRTAAVMDEEQIHLFYTSAQLVVKGGVSAMKERVRKLLEIHAVKPLPSESVSGRKESDEGIEAPNLCPADGHKMLQFYNGIGGFSEDGREYIIHLHKDQVTPAPWSNVISNRRFGFLVTEVGGGYTWAENSRENKLTPWSNDPVIDMPGEVFYIKDLDRDRFWSVTPMPVRQEETYVVRHGFGYSIFEHTSHGLEQNLTLLAAAEEPVKLCVITLRNITGAQRNLSLTCFIRPVLGVNDSVTSPYIITCFDASSGLLAMENRYNSEFAGRVAFIGSSEPNPTFTGDRSEFVGVHGSLSEPAALFGDGLSGKTGAGLDPCAAMQVKVTLAPGQGHEVVFLLGQTEDIRSAAALAAAYKASGSARKEMERVRSHWDEKLGSLRVSTPDTSMNLVLNGWYLYQVIVCRLWSRSAFYQSGGAYGFRDQLQDSMAVTYTWPELTRSQILLHASRQFVEGDVQHWWHAEVGKGIRTRYSDDLLWLPFVTSDYIENSGDWAILEEEVPYLEDRLLSEHEDERYSVPTVSGQQGSLYDHCVRTIEISLRFGSHGIPLMGSGDWNDGMNTVGNKGRGESVWMGWFLYTVLKRFIPLCRRMKEEERAARYETAAREIAEALEREAWDGSWYRRAYFDDGTPLGSVQNSECRIDSIAQSWSVISGAARPGRAEEAMSSLENYLIDRGEGIVKLLAPPFDEGVLRPGYIKGYVPGVRENGGQYTHAAAWVVLAFAKLGYGDKAWELFHLINPINHARTPIEYCRYKVEPYVVAADVYAVPPHTGRGGWTWYTGAAGWLYRIGMEHILGLKKRDGSLVFDPCIPKNWDRYGMEYRFGKTLYRIEVSNPDKVNHGVVMVSVDGTPRADGKVPLLDDGVEHRVLVLMGPDRGKE